jgi:hypothetical protein
MSDFRDRLKHGEIASIARGIGRSYEWTHAVLKGGARPSVDDAQKIDLVTGGRIKWTEFFAPMPEAS